MMIKRLEASIESFKVPRLSHSLLPVITSALFAFLTSGFLGIITYQGTRAVCIINNFVQFELADKNFNN